MPDTDKNEAQEMVSHLTGWSTTPKKLSPQNEDAQLKIFQTFFWCSTPTISEDRR